MSLIATLLLGLLLAILIVWLATLSLLVFRLHQDLVHLWQRCQVSAWPAASKETVEAPLK